ncbi:BLUF domain-containing protein [Pseudomonadales bacterium]|jgi:hypothetical protein|nr:BLUF domain-containing protein [Pseudomonadales bacterium]MDB4528556.1 BLUF domain-containing protein [Pseudomonadales bacterium]
MFHVIYISKATQPFSQVELTELLSKARQRNTQRLLTGLLLYADGCFMQLLEGKEATVMDVYGRIKQDTRHTDIVTLRMEETPSRHFPDWRMAFGDLSGGTQNLAGISRFLEPGFNSSTLKNESSNAYELLRAFRDEHCPKAKQGKLASGKQLDVEPHH